jgi:predicted glutamine amidotransferase
MCRMIAAVGRFEAAPLVAALRAMAANANAEHEHELRSEGPAFTHDCGWGAAYRDGGRLARRRSASSCLEDPRFEDLAALETDMLVLHARRTPHRDTIAVGNSHPFIAEYGGMAWAFCHNGAVNDLTQLDGAGGLPDATVDSELLFHHVLRRLDLSDPAGSLARTLAEVRDFTCLNCLLASQDEIIAHARAAADTTRPHYYTLWRGRGDGIALVSSEPFGRGPLAWSPVPSGTAFTLAC